MENQLLQEYSLNERKTYLRDSAEKAEEFTYPKGLNEQEVIQLREDYTVNAIKMAKHEESKKEFMECFKSDTKPLKIEMESQMTMIRSKVEEVTETVYHIADQTEGMMGYYNEKGILVYQRPLFQSERQFRIVDESTKNASNGN